MGSPGGTSRSWRPFWMHQGAEYVLALMLVASGLQSPQPLWPSLAGGLVLVNTALSGPPLGAFAAVPRATHRRLDIVVVGAVVIAAVLPFLDIDSATRLVMAGVAAVLAVVWWGTSFEPKRPSARVAPAAGRLDSEHVGRLAGRLVAKAGDSVRKRQQR